MALANVSDPGVGLSDPRSKGRNLIGREHLFSRRDTLAACSRPSGARSAWSNKWNNHVTKRWQHWMLRHYIVLLLLKEGLGVYQTDVDMMFLDNPYYWLD